VSRWYTLNTQQFANLKRVPQGIDISTIAAVDLEALRLVELVDTNDGIEVRLTDRGRVTLISGRVVIEE
jgi:hypothetical protein